MLLLSLITKAPHCDLLQYTNLSGKLSWKDSTVFVNSFMRSFTALEYCTVLTNMLNRPEMGMSKDQIAE